MNKNLRNQIIYQVFPRQHSKTSDFNGVTKDLDRIKELGVDIVYLLPIHPIGQKNKKGSIGCPYSIQDYRKVCLDLGTLEDFKKLIDETHKREMKLMIDVVYNHTSRDSVILNTHPEWMYKNEQGEFKGKVGDWWDVTDLDYTNLDLWDDLIDTLCYWAKLGVDGYRCDVASMVPLKFWIKAKEELLKINPNFIMFAESIHADFIKFIRDSGFEAYSDCEMYQAFDLLYDYDIITTYDEYLKDHSCLNDWLKALYRQEMIYPMDYAKAHGLENHDRERAAKFVKDEIRLRNLNALMFFLKGTTFIYAGQEACEEKLESLFEIDLTDWSTLGKYDMVNLIKKCASLKKDRILKDGAYNIHFEEEEIAHITYKLGNELLECVFNLGNIKGTIDSKQQDGKYINLFNGDVIEVTNGKLPLYKEPIIIKNV